MTCSGMRSGCAQTPARRYGVHASSPQQHCLARLARRRTKTVSAAEAVRSQPRVRRAALQGAPHAAAHLASPLAHSTQLRPDRTPARPFGRSRPTCSLPAAPVARPAPPPAAAPGRGALAQGAGPGLPARALAAWRAAPEAPAARPEPLVVARPPCGGPSPRAPGRSVPTSPGRSSAAPRVPAASPRPRPQVA